MNPLPILFGYNLSGIGNSSVPMAFCHYWNKQGYPSRLYAPSSEHNTSSKWLMTPLGPLTRKFFYRFLKKHSASTWAEKYCLKKEKNNSFVYLWAGLSLEIFERFHQSGSTIIVERINCHQATAKTILDRAFAKLKLTPGHDINDISIGLENKKLDLADVIFCPSPMVYRSMLENGVDENKLLSTSYGWEPGRFPNLEPEPRQNRKPVFLFVGNICIRKGIPLLLKAWEKADIDGRLIVCGAMENAIEHHFGHYLQRDDITYIPYTRDIGKFYNMADVFVFPSHEEGGPMVTYEAMAHGIVPLVSEMGAGAVVQDKQNGLILSNNIDDWATAITAVWQNVPKRVQLGKAARKRALNFTWEKVAAKRAQLLQDHFPSLWCQL